jgi:hypothetical protein
MKILFIRVDRLFEQLLIVKLGFMNSVTKKYLAQSKNSKMAEKGINNDEMTMKSEVYF